MSDSNPAPDPPANAEGSGPVIIGIAGGSGSGKTTVAANLRDGISGGRCTVVEHDWYYRDQSHLSAAARSQVNYDHPDTLESSLLAQHLRAMRRGESIDAPVYDFVTHTRERKADGTFAGRRIDPVSVVIVEGILVFADADLRAELDIKIFVDTDADIRLLRRIRRDLETRGRPFESIRDQYQESVRPMHLEFVEPSKRWADLIVPEGGENRVALDLLLVKLRQITA